MPADSHLRGASETMVYGADELPTWLVFTLLASVATVVFVIQMTGLPNLFDNEFRLGATVLNVLLDGNWICPHDSVGNTDKPPLLTWLSALISLPFGLVNRFTMYLPTAIATLALSWITFTYGRRYFGWRAGFLGGLAYLLSHAGAQQIATARWDGLFALTVVVAALAAFQAWMRGTGWLWFWLGAAAATLTKGPLGVLLAGLGLGASMWERRSGTPKAIRGSQLGGIVVFFMITCGWFLLAYRQVGWHLVDNMIGQELVGHVVEHGPGRKVLKPVGDFLVNFGPWSLFTCLAVYRIVRTSTPDDTVRRFERFLVCWCVGGLLVFSISPHNPARLLWPVMPPAAMLAGRELGRLSARMEAFNLGLGCAGAIGLAGAFFCLQSHLLDAKNAEVQQTLAIQRLAGILPERIGEGASLEYVDTPYALQLSLNTLRPAISFPEAAARLSGEPPTVVAVVDVNRLKRIMGPHAAGIHELTHGALAGKPYIHIVSNRPPVGSPGR